MSSSTISYVLIPKDFNIDDHLKIKEQANIINDVDINIVKNIINYVCKNQYLRMLSDGLYDPTGTTDCYDWEYAITILEELDFIIYIYEYGSILCGDVIVNIGHELKTKKELVQKILDEE